MKVNQLLEAEKKDVTPLTKINRIARAMEKESTKFKLRIKPDMGFSNRKTERTLKVDMYITKDGPLDFSKLIDPSDPNAEAIKARMLKKIGTLPDPDEFVLDEAQRFLDKVREQFPNLKGVAVETDHGRYEPCSFEEFRNMMKQFGRFHAGQSNFTFMMIFPLSDQASFTLSTEMQRWKRALGAIGKKIKISYPTGESWDTPRIMDSSLGRDLIFYPYEHLSEYEPAKSGEPLGGTWIPGKWDMRLNAKFEDELKRFMQAAEPKMQELAASCVVDVSWRMGLVPVNDKFDKSSIGYWLNKEVINKDEYLKKMKVFIISFGDFKS